MNRLKKGFILVLTFLLLLTGMPLQPGVFAATPDYVTVTKTVNPTSITPEEEAEVTLQLQGTPPGNVVVPNDVILIIDKSGSMAPGFSGNNGEDKMQAAKDAAKGFIDMMDLTKHRVGIVDFSSSKATGTYPLTTDGAAAKAYIDTIRANGSTATGYSIEKAMELLQNKRPEARPVIVIMTDGDATEGKPTPYDHAKLAATAAKDAGITFYTIALLNRDDDPETSGPNLLLKEMATTAAHHHFVLGSQGLDEIYAAIVREIGYASAYDVVLTDVVAPEFEIVPGSYSHNIPQPKVVGNTLTWEFLELKDTLLTFTYKIRPKSSDTTGNFLIGTNDAKISYKDYAGVVTEMELPNAYLEVKYPAPIITSIVEDHGHPNGGEHVVIYGDHFRPGATVKFGNNLATNVVVVSKTEITLIAPAGVVGERVTVTVENPDGQQATTQYWYKADPVVFSIEPDNGPLEGGNTVVISGENFANGITVTFGGVEAQVSTYVNTGEIHVIVPAATVPGAVDVVLTNPDGTTVTFANGYTYNEPPKEYLEIYSVTPDIGELAGGELVVIAGKKIDPNATIYFGNNVAVLNTYYSAEQIRVVVPAGDQPGPVDVTVVNPDGETASLLAGYTYKEAPPVIPAPEIISVTPNEGFLEGGEEIAIEGNFFVDGLNVYFGENKATVTSFVSENLIYVIAPPAKKVGEVNVKVVNPDGQQGVKLNGYTYIEKPKELKITLISPESGPLEGSNLVFIDGEGFDPNIKVYFGNQEAGSLTYYNDTRIRVSAPASAVEGSVDVRVVNPDGNEAVAVDGYTYQPPDPSAPPTITDFTPDSVEVGKTVLVYIDGTGFANGLKVYFGDQEGTALTYYNSTRIRINAPVSAVEGTVTVKVVNPDGQEIVATKGFTYLPPAPKAPPTITAYTPDNGPINKTTLVYIDGTDFVNGLEVYFGDQKASALTFYNSTRIRATAPVTSVAGIVDLKVINPDGQSVTVPFTYYVPAPDPVEITLITPNSGLALGGNYVTLEGAGFKSTSKVSFGSETVSVNTFYSSSKIRVLVPSSKGQIGPVDVTVTNPDGGTHTLSNGYTYEGVFPKITNISPASGPMKGGTLVYIDGENFAPNMTVTIGGVEVGFTYYNTTRFRIATPASATPGEVDVVVTLPSLETASTIFTYEEPPAIPAPVITNFTPTSGPVSGGTLIYIDGTGFQSGLKVYVDGVQLTTGITYYNSTRIRITAPKASAPGFVDIKIVNPDGQESNTIQFEYK